MTYSATLAELRADVYEAADAENKTARHPAARVNRHILKSHRDAIGMVLMKMKHTILERKEGTITTTDGVSFIPQPEDMVRPHIVALSDGTDFWQLEEFSLAEAAALHTSGTGSKAVGRPLYYRMNFVGPCGLTIQILPPADMAYTYILFFVPTVSPLASDTQTAELVHGEFMRWIVADSAQELCIKDKDSERFAFLAARKGEYEGRLSEQLGRNAGTVVTRRDTRAANASYKRSTGWDGF